MASPQTSVWVLRSMQRHSPPLGTLSLCSTTAAGVPQVRVATGAYIRSSLNMGALCADGVPRHVVYVSEQLDDYRTVVKWCRQQPDLDPQRVILWGTSFAGAVVCETSLTFFSPVFVCIHY